MIIVCVLELAIIPCGVNYFFVLFHLIVNIIICVNKLDIFTTVHYVSFFYIVGTHIYTLYYLYFLK